MYSFEENSKQIEVRGLAQRISNATIPNRPKADSRDRVDDRYNRSLSTVLLPWADGKAVIGAPLYAVTKDISEVGLSLVLREPAVPPQMVCGFWLDAPYFVRAELRHSEPIGGGFWQVGIEMTELFTLADQDDHEQLEQLAANLDPKQSAELAVH